MENIGTVTTDEAKLLALKAELNAKNVPSSYYSIGKERNERMCILMHSGKWSVFYSERGQMTDLMEFPNFEDARDELLRRFS